MEEAGNLLEQFLLALKSWPQLRVEEFLRQRGGGSLAMESLLELIFAEMVFRSESGDNPKLDEYVRRFPAQHSRLQTLFELQKNFLNQPAPTLAQARAADCSLGTALLQQAGLLQSAISTRNEIDLSLATLSETAISSGDPAECESQVGEETLIVSTAEEAGSLRDVSLGELRDAGILDAEDCIAGCQAVRILGRGGMGVVLEVRDSVLHRHIALKAMLPQFASSNEARQRFLREARAVASVVHDQIMPIYQVGEDRGIPFLTMPLLEGETLESRLKRQRWLSAEEVIRIAEDATAGLAAAHAVGLIHRDIKPSNIWLLGPVSADAVPRWRRLMIFDFGLVRLADQSTQVTQSGNLVGTPAYMAPEQAQSAHPDNSSSRRLDGRADLFSLGVVLYQALTGICPFSRPGIIPTLHALAFEDPPPASRWQPDVPRDLERLINDLLQKKPERRPASAEMVLQRLQSLHTALTAKNAFAAKPPASRKMWWLLGLAFTITAMWLAVFLLQLRTSEGLLILECESGTLEGAKVIVNGTREVVIHRAGQNDPVSISVPSGEGRLLIRAAGFETYTQDFRLKGGDHQVLRIRLEPIQVAVQNSGPSPAGPRKISSPKQEPPQPPPVLMEAERERNLAQQRVDAEWLLRSKAAVAIDGSGGRKVVEKLEDLPAGPFYVWSVHFGALGSQRKWVDDAALARLSSFLQMERLFLDGTSITDRGLRSLAPLHNLQMIELDHTSITDVGLSYLSVFTQLKTLNLSRTQVTDEGLQHLRPLTQLEMLDLSQTKVMNDGLRVLQELPNLKTLSLYKTSVGNAGAVHIGGIAPLLNLNMDETNLRDDGVRALCASTRYEDLTIRWNQITDAGIAHLHRLQRMHTLRLSYTNVTDKCIPALIDLEGLRILDIDKAGITLQGAQQFQKTHPHCVVGGFDRKLLESAILEGVELQRKKIQAATGK